MPSAALARLTAGEALLPGQMRAFVRDLMAGMLAEDNVVEFLIALRKKGESTEDIFEAAEAMREYSTPLPADGELLDTCGTGGDGAHTLNVSTLAAIAAAACGARVAKHGNRSVSGLFGSADLLEALGIPVDPGPEAVAKCLAETGFGFMYAPRFHPAMKHAAGARKRIEGRTIFNLLGPLTNPANASRQLVGVFSPRMTRPVCEALARLGARHAIVVSSADGLDEVSLSGETRVVEWQNRTLSEYTVKPEDYGLHSVALKSLQCDSRPQAIERANEVLAGRPGAALDFVSLNAAFALKAAGKWADLKQNVETARQAFRTGSAMRKVAEIKKALGA